MKTFMIVLGFILVSTPVIIGLIAGLYVIIFPLTAFSCVCTVTVVSMVSGASLLGYLGVI